MRQYLSYNYSTCKLLFDLTREPRSFPEEEAYSCSARMKNTLYIAKRVIRPQELLLNRSLMSVVAVLCTQKHGLPL